MLRRFLTFTALLGGWAGSAGGFERVGPRQTATVAAPGRTGTAGRRRST